MTAVVTERLRRDYNRKGRPARTALGGLDLVVEPGEVRGLLGPNGAGKTTLCKILSTVLLPTSGTARIQGHDVVAEARVVRTLIGIAFGGERGLYGRLTARANLRYWSALYRQPSAVGKARSAELLDRVGLGDRADERVETFSRGMKQRLHLARALIANPPVVILDEPTTGMDPVAAHDFRVLVGELRTERRTVLLTTHDLAEAEAVCDRVSLIDGGVLLGTEDPRTIGRWLSRYERVSASDVPPATVEAVRALPGVSGVTEQDGRITVETSEDGAVGRVLRALVAAGVTTLSTAPPSLEEVYLRLIGERGLEVR